MRTPSAAQTTGSSLAPATTAARRAAFYVAEGDTLTVLLGGIRRFTKYDASGLLEAKRRLAAAVLERERYPF